TSAHIGGPFGPFGVAVDGAGTVFLSDTVVDSSGYNTDYRVRKVSPSGIITTVAGNGTYGPAGLAVDGAGGLFIADSMSNRIRKVSPDGTINTVAGNGAFCSYSPSGQLTCPPPGDGGPAASAPLNWPLGVTLDEGGNLFIASTWGGNEVNFGAGVIRKVSSSGIITTVAGNGASCFYVANGLSCPPLGDGGPAASAHLTAPTGVA